AAETASDMTLGWLLHPERASRLIQQKGLDQNQLGLPEVLDKMIQSTFHRNHKDDYLKEIQRSINFRVLYHLMNLAGNDGVHPQVNAIANHHLRTLLAGIGPEVPGDPNRAEIARRITDFYKFPEQFKVVPSPKIPDGSPIGLECMY
ncbi:MAG TPA: hypothetical protein VKN36_01865, partial [Eudoraea sp.]|nr:hypothetical protein [Eudoraea sp.]